ncbi:retention module-containing protein, partial [Halomonas sp. NCCP-2165]
MAMPTILSITGQAWARDADGNLRELNVGDTLRDGEVLVTSDNGSVQLDFNDGLSPLDIGGGQEIAMTPEVDAETPPDVEASSVQDADLDALLAALDAGEGDLLELLDATAAGAGGGGGASGGHDFVRLARVAEDTPEAEPAFEFSAAQPGQAPDIEGADAAGATEPLDITAEITVSLADVNGNNVANAPITGTTTDVEAGQTVNLTITDGTTTVTATATVQADGSYETTADLSDLTDGELTVTATVQDQAGNEATATDAADLDTEASATISIDTIAGDDVINAAEAGDDITITITGSVGGDAGEGDSVTLTVGGTDYTGTVDADGNYAIEVPGSVLAGDNQVEASVSGSDEAGNPFTADTSRPYGVDTEASATITIDTIAGDDVINAAEAGQTISITGSVGGDAGEGDSVTLTVGD